LESVDFEFAGCELATLEDAENHQDDEAREVQRQRRAGGAPEGTPVAED